MIIVNDSIVRVDLFNILIHIVCQLFKILLRYRNIFSDVLVT